MASSRSPGEVRAAQAPEPEREQQDQGGELGPEQHRQGAVALLEGHGQVDGQPVAEDGQHDQAGPEHGGP
jgi:hypothetical protein